MPGADGLVRFVLAHEQAWVALISIVKVEDAHSVGNAITRVFADAGRDFELVKYCILRELIETSDETQILRGTGVRPTILAKSGMLHGRAYLQKVIAPVLSDKVHKAGSFEVDPVRLNGNTKEALKNAESLVSVCNHLLAALLASANEMPVMLRKTYEYARRMTEGKFPEHAKRVPASLFFLRLLCPALVAPEANGLCKNRLSDEAQRAHVLLAKLMQSVANEVPPFEKEAYMQPLNAWVASAIPSVRRFFRIALGMVSDDTFETQKKETLQRLHAVPNPTSINDAKTLFNFVRKNQVAYRAELMSMTAFDLLPELSAVLTPPDNDLALRSIPSSSDAGSETSLSPRSAESDGMRSPRELIASRSTPPELMRTPSPVELQPRWTESRLAASDQHVNPVYGDPLQHSASAELGSSARRHKPPTPHDRKGGSLIMGSRVV